MLREVKRLSERDGGGMLPEYQRAFREIETAAFGRYLDGLFGAV